MKYQFEESGFTDKNYLPLSPNFRRNPKVFWVYHDNDCIPKWKNPGEANLINHYLSDVIQRFNSDVIGIVTPFVEQKKVLIKEIKQDVDMEEGKLKNMNISSIKYPSYGLIC